MEEIRRKKLSQKKVAKDILKENTGCNISAVICQNLASARFWQMFQVFEKNKR
jgi:hypothetical protein